MHDGIPLCSTVSRDALHERHRTMGEELGEWEHGSAFTRLRNDDFFGEEISIPTARIRPIRHVDPGISPGFSAKWDH